MTYGCFIWKRIVFTLTYCMYFLSTSHNPYFYSLPVKSVYFGVLRYSLYLKPLSLKSISENTAPVKKGAISNLNAGLVQVHVMLQSNRRYFYRRDLPNKTLLLHWSKECIYFLEHVEASFPSSTRNCIPPPSCPPLPRFPCSLLYVMKTQAGKQKWFWRRKKSLAEHTVLLLWF